MVDKHDPLKRIKYSESKGQGGASPGQLYKKKKETYHQGELFPLAKGRKDKFKNDPFTSPNAS